MYDIKVTQHNQNAFVAYFRKYCGINIITEEIRKGTTKWGSYFVIPPKYRYRRTITDEQNGITAEQVQHLVTTKADTYEEAQRLAIEEARKITNIKQMKL